MALSPDDLRKIVNLLEPHVMSDSERRTLVISAFGSGHPLSKRIEYSGKPHDFAVNLVNRVDEYGEIALGKPALVALLDALKPDVGIEDAALIDAMIASLGEPAVSTASPQSGTKTQPKPEELKTVFISYRPKPAAYIARAVFQDLSEHSYDVFMDVERIDSGDFKKIIRNQIKARAHFLIILTAGTISQFAEPNDLLREEIEYAMQQGRNIVPLLIDEFKFDKRTEKYLTGKLDTLSSLTAVTIHHDLFEASMEKLRTRFLKQPMNVETTPAPASEQPEVQRKVEQVVAQPAPTNEELSAEELFNRAYDKVEANDLDGAIADYNEAIRLNPKFAEAYGNRGNVRKLQGDLDGAIADYDIVVNLYPIDDLPLNNRAIARKAKGDLDGALADCDEAIRLNPKSSETHFNRAGVRKAKGDLDGALADYDEAIRLNPHFDIAYNNRAGARKAKSDLDGAIADFNEAIRLNPQDDYAYYNRGNARLDKDDPDGAMADYSEAIRLNPQNADAYYNRGNTRGVKGDYDEAIADYQKYLDLGGGKRNGDQSIVEQIIGDLRRALKR